MRSLLAVAASCSLVLACQATSPNAVDQVAELGVWMTGTFTSTAQAEADPDNYFDIHLSMVPIWTDRSDGPWLYIEQAAASALDRPYRQRVYHLVPDDGGVRSDVFELPGDPLAFAGAWQTPERFDEFAPDALTERTGCSIYLARKAGRYGGATLGDACISSLRGASYATSEVIVEPDLLTSWDRGWDDSGEQVWGAELGPYRFVRVPAER